MNGVGIDMILRGVNTAALLGLLTLAAKLWVQNKSLAIKDLALSMQGKVEDRQGYGALIETQGRELARLAARVETLESEKEADHKLIVELLNQMSRTQAVAILGSQNVSSALRRALESTIGEPQ